MSISIVSSTISGTNSSGTTSPGIDTTGATLLIVGLAYYNASGAPTFSDSKGNTWTGLTQRGGSLNNLRLYYAVNPTVGTGHTFTASGASSFAALGVLALSGAATSSPFDVESATSVTPTQDNELLVAISGNPTPGSFPSAISDGFTIQHSIANSSGNYFGFSIAYQIQTTATARTPVWTNGDGNAIATFKAAAGGGGGFKAAWARRGAAILGGGLR